MGFETAGTGAATTSFNDIDPSSRLEVYVLYTGIRSTLSALRTAAQLSQGLGSIIRLMLVETVPYPLPLNEPRRTPRFLGRQFRTLVEGCESETACRSVETIAQIVFCRDACEGLCQELKPASVVVIGKRSRWGLLEEDRWARKLRQAGHHVVRTSAPASPGITGIFVKGFAHV